MTSLEGLPGFLHSLQNHIAGFLEWVRKYRAAGYFIVVMISARITWRVYKSMSARRAHKKRTLAPAQWGQAALGAVQEIAQLLAVDPRTDWSKVNFAPLRQHLIDMDELTLRATAREEPVDKGVRIEISGSARTLEAIQRSVPVFAEQLNKHPGWAAKVEAAVDGTVLTVTSTDRQQVARIRGLGFIGLLASAPGHNAYHLDLVTTPRPQGRSFPLPRRPPSREGMD